MFINFVFNIVIPYTKFAQLIQYYHSYPFGLICLYFGIYIVVYTLVSTFVKNCKYLPCLYRGLLLPSLPQCLYDSNNLGMLL